MYKFANKAPDGNVLWVNILASLQVALSGFLAAIIIGVPLGLVMGWWTYADRFIRPIFELVRPVPPIAWIPLVVVWMGIGPVSYTHLDVYKRQIHARTVNRHR